MICIGIVYSLVYSISVIKEVGVTIPQLGLGTVSTWTMIRATAAKTGASDLLSNNLIANIGQLVFSLIYFSYNRIFTMFSWALEWESYAKSHKALRVSGIPRGEQKSKHFLALPYRIAIPLLIFSGFIHWLISQSIFLVVIEYRHFDYQSDSWTRKLSDIDKTFSGCGFSPLAIVILSVTIGVMFVALMITACWRLKTTMPLAGNCSAAIAAACHISAGEQGQEISTSKIRWGVTGYRNDGIGHCSFSKIDVTAPEVDQLYE